MDNIDYGAVFGVETGSETQSAETSGTAQGEKEQAVAEPAAENKETGNKEAEKTAESEKGQAVSADGDSSVQNPEENAKYAAARRKAESERDAAIAEAERKAREDAQKYVDDAFANSGMMNPYTGKPITSKSEYEEYKQKYETEKKSRFIKRAGISDAEFEEFINDLPVVKEAREKQKAAEQQIEQMRSVALKAKVDEQITEIGKLDPSIKSVDDLMKKPTYQKFFDLVKMGHTMVDAYKYANMDELAANAASSVRQQTMNQLNSKNHLEKTMTRGSGAEPVPASVRAQYLAFNPDATDSEISAHYNSYIKK